MNAPHTVKGKNKSKPYYLRQSDKLKGQKSFILIRNGTVFLRIIDENPIYNFMTATTDEYGAGLKVCRNQNRLLEAAVLLCDELNMAPVAARDNTPYQNPYVKMFQFNYNASVSDADANALLEDALDRFFDIYDSLWTIR